jgi:hypothetical protein
MYRLNDGLQGQKPARTRSVNACAALKRENQRSFPSLGGSIFNAQGLGFLSNLAAIPAGADW